LTPLLYFQLVLSSEFAIFEQERK